MTPLDHTPYWSLPDRVVTIGGPSFAELMAGAPCGFCDHRADDHDVHQEEDYPDVPCCADEEACHARVTGHNPDTRPVIRAHRVPGTPRLA